MLITCFMIARWWALLRTSFYPSDCLTPHKTGRGRTFFYPSQHGRTQRPIVPMCFQLRAGTHAPIWKQQQLSYPLHIYLIPKERTPLRGKHKRSFSLPSEAGLNFDNCRANKDHCIKKHFATISPDCCSMSEHNHHRKSKTAILNVPACRHTKNVNTYSRTAPVWIQYSRTKGNLCHSGQGA